MCSLHVHDFLEFMKFSLPCVGTFRVWHVLSSARVPPWKDDECLLLHLSVQLKWEQCHKNATIECFPYVTHATMVFRCSYFKLIDRVSFSLVEERPEQKCYGMTKGIAKDLQLKDFTCACMPCHSVFDLLYIIPLKALLHEVFHPCVTFFLGWKKNLNVWSFCCCCLHGLVSGWFCPYPKR